METDKVLEKNLMNTANKVFVSDSDLLALLKPTDDGAQVPKFDQTVLESLGQERLRLLEKVRENWSDVEKILIKIKKTKEKRDALNSGILFLEYMFYRVNDNVYDCLARLYVLQKILYNNTESVLRDIKYDELSYD